MRNPPQRPGVREGWLVATHEAKLDARDLRSVRSRSGQFTLDPKERTRPMKADEQTARVKPRQIGPVVSDDLFDYRTLRLRDAVEGGVDGRAKGTG